MWTSKTMNCLRRIAEFDVRMAEENPGEWQNSMGSMWWLESKVIYEGGGYTVYRAPDDSSATFYYPDGASSQLSKYWSREIHQGLHVDDITDWLNQMADAGVY